MITSIILLTGLSVPLTQPADFITLNEAIEKASARRISYRYSQSQVQEADLQLILAGKNRLPFAGFSANTRYQSDNIQVDISGISGLPFSIPPIEGPHLSVDLSLGVQHPLLSGGRLESGIELSRLAADSAKQRLRLVRSQLEWDVKQLYYSERLLEVQNQSVCALKKSLELHLHRLKELYTAGLSSKAELIEIEEKITEIDLSLMEIARNRLLVSDRFQDYTGLELVRIDPDHSELIPEKTELAGIIENHPALEISRIGEKRSAAQERLSTADYRPRLSLFAELHGGTPGVNMLSDDWKVYGVAGIGFQMTLFDFNKRKEIHAIHLLQQEQIRFEKNRQREQFLASAESLYNQIDALVRQKDSCLRMVELAEQFLAHQERLWRENQASHTDYLTALEHLTQQQCRLDQLHWQIERLKGEISFTLASAKGE